MVKRTSYRQYGLILFVLVILLASWESNRTQAAVLHADIPEQSIRLRILANSDLPADQLMKRVIRDEIIRQVEQWVSEPDGIVEARETVRRHLPQLEQLVGQVLSDYGVEYAYQVELGQVPFPAKLYGNQVYPAGEYEALRITLGSGEGQNWWCVLFPPLCFVDGKAGVAVAKKAAAASSKQTEAGVNDAPSGSKPAVVDAEETGTSEDAVEVKFFLLEAVVKAVDSFKRLFA